MESLRFEAQVEESLEGVCSCVHWYLHPAKIDIVRL